MKKGIVILGSTGSIGRSTLDVIERRQDEFEVIGLACRENVQLFSEQIRKFRPRLACIADGSRSHLVDFGKTRSLFGPEGMKALVRAEGEMIVNALPGSIGLESTIEALTQKKVLGLANKESLVMAGRLISRLAREKGATLLPICHVGWRRACSGVTAFNSSFERFLKGPPEAVMKSDSVSSLPLPSRSW